MTRSEDDTRSRLRALEERLHRIENARPAPPPNLRDLSDVKATKVVDGQVLVYKATSGRWEQAASPTGGGGGGLAEPTIATGVFKAATAVVVNALATHDLTSGSYTWARTNWAPFLDAVYDTANRRQLVVEDGLYVVTQRLLRTAGAPTSGALIYDGPSDPALGTGWAPRLYVPVELPNYITAEVQTVLYLRAGDYLKPGYFTNETNVAVTAKHELWVEQLGKWVP